MLQTFIIHSKRNYFPLTLSLIFLSISVNVAGVTTFEEDFSDQGEWALFSADWQNSGTVGPEFVESKISVTDGRLVSERSHNTVWDHAFHSLEQSEGTWEFDAMFTEAFLHDWQFELDYIPSGNASDAIIEGSTEEVVALLVVFRSSQIIVNQLDLDGEDAQAYFRTDDYNEVGIDYHYKIIKDLEAISVYVEDELLVEHPLVDQVDNFNIFGIGTSTPISFDNFKVSDEMLYPPEGPEETGPEETRDDFLSTSEEIKPSTTTAAPVGNFVLLSLGLITITIGYLNKKKSKNSSND